VNLVISTIEAEMRKAMKKRITISILLLSAMAVAAERQPVTPPNSAKPIGPYTPGILTSRFLYVSGQGMNDTSGKSPATWEAQVRQCLENVKSIVETAKLTMGSVVATQVYVDDLKKWPAASKIYAEYFPKEPPALTLLEVAKLPGGTLVEINAIAVRDSAGQKPIAVPGMAETGPYSTAVTAGKRVYISSITGRNRADADLQPRVRAGSTEQPRFSRLAVLTDALLGELHNPGA